MKIRKINDTFEVRFQKNGRQFRRRFTTETEARNWVVSFDSTQGANDSELAGVSVDEIVKEYVDKKRAALNRRHAGALGMNELMELFLDARRDITNKTKTTYKSYLKRFAQSIKSKRIRAESIDRVMVRSFAAGMTSSVHNAFIKNINAFFRWLIAEGYVAHNPAEGIRMLKIPEPPRGIVKPEHLTALLATAVEKHPCIVPIITIGAFAGVRPHEVMRLRSGNIRDGYILLHGAITKTADTRSVAIRPNLREWLNRFPLPENHISYRHFARMLSECWRAAAPGEKWPHDALRHSFASYAYEMTKDAAAVAAEMGHGGTRIFFKHYRALVAPGDGARWFSISPENTLPKP